MKKHYVKPIMTGEEFLAEEFVSACGDTEYGVYKFTCNAGDGKEGGLYIGQQSFNGVTYWKRVSSGSKSYHACNDTHETSVWDEYREGIFDPDTDHNNGNEIPCLIWYHLGQYTGHASEGLTRDEWEVLKS